MSEWLKSLRAGDEVAIRKELYYKTMYEKVKVVRITPTGRISLSNGSQYFSDGRKVGGSYNAEKLEEHP